MRGWNLPGKPTIKDIARLVGVSHSTVSRALNGSPLISSVTRERIQAIADRMDFEFNEGARRLKNRKTGIIGVLYYSVLNDFRSSLYTNELFRDLRHSLERVGLDALVVEAYNDQSGQSNIARLIRQNKVDGFVIIHPEIRREDYELIKVHKLPIVHIHMISDGISRDSVDCFFTDNYEGGHLAARHLIDSGCRKIQVVRIDENEAEEFRQRTLGCLSALEEAGFIVDVEGFFSCDCSYKGGYRLVKENHIHLREYDGIFIPADIAAFGFLNALKEEGIRVPEDLKVIGFDDSPVGRMTLPSLTTIHQPREELADKASKRIRSLLFDDTSDEPIQEYVKPALVIRESS
ncbi:MAG: LacI family transcriptional regulator [Spirochaetes bacterium]|nr:MAG: LacI family transcriptional regulator [Spirochaetota bacterium]